MKNYYLRVAATNFDAFLLDTQDLSTVRGGGLLLREAIDRVAKRHSSLQEVSTGASEGLFRFEVETTAEAEEQCCAVREQLRTDPDLRQATFVVDLTRKSKGFGLDKEVLRARNAWQQMQSPSLAFPSSVGEGSLPCELDRLRPASARYQLRGQRMSESAHRRRRHGLERKQDFYQHETGIEVEAGFSPDLGKLSSDRSRGSLDGKIAVLYIDGNDFSGVQGRHVDSPKAQTEFDRTLKETRRAVLRTMVELAQKTPALREGGTGPLRLETLLWGGDELTWVLPGWAGLWALNQFFGLPNEASPRFQFSGEELYHAAGLVLCHHDAPIHRIRDLAEELAGLAKDEDRDRNLLAYEVLESFDDVGDDLADYRDGRRPPGLLPQDLFLDPWSVVAAQRAYGALRPEIPVRQLRRAVDALYRGQGGAYRDAVERLRATLDGAGLGAAYGDLVAALGGDGAAAEPTALLHHATLGEYLAPLELPTDSPRHIQVDEEEPEDD